MTVDQAAAHTARFATLTLLTTATITASHHQWTPAGLFALGALYVAAISSGRARRRIVEARHEQARRAARADGIALATPVPCCQFWRHSDGAVHGPDCTRPADARRDDYRLGAADRAAFAEITAHYDDRSAA